MIYITTFGLTNKVDKADVSVVFGNEIKPNGEPSPRLKARLDKAIQLYQQGYAPVIIVSGGIEPKGFDEALVMKSYLVHNGIAENRIYSDNQGKNTYSTAHNVSLMMRSNGWKSVLLVSQFYHLARSRLAFERFGITTVYSAHANFFELRDLYSLGREVFALLVYQVRSYE